MADKTKFDDSLAPSGGEPSDLDPFAELKRIMGLDPHESATPANSTEAAAQDIDFAEAIAKADQAEPVSSASSAGIARHIEAAQNPNQDIADDFGIDLERELMGEFLTAEQPAQAVSASTDEIDFDAAFSEQADSLDAAFEDQPQSQSEIDADLEELNNVFAEAEPTKVEAVVEAKPDADDDIAIALDESDFADIDEAIALEMDEALSAGFATTVGADKADIDLGLDEALAAGLGDLDAAQPEPAKPELKGLADVDMDFGSELDWSELDAPRAQAANAPATKYDTDELLAALDAAASKITDESGVSAVKSDASNEVPSATLANMSDQYESRGNQYDWRQPVRNTQPRAAAPEVETTEMFDQAFSMTDDLDLPEVRYDEPVQAASDIDLEFDNLLNEMSREPVRPVRAAAASEAPRYKPRQPAPRAEDFDFDSVFGEPAPQAAAAPQAYQPRTDHDLVDFDFDENDFDDEQPARQAAYRPHNGGGRGGRGMMIAAIVGGVALLGGIGAMAMSWNNDPGAPALVKADASPVKIRPENPGGGIAVPNQDSAVYDTVSRSGAPQPAQERLVSATEDPIALPQPDDSEVDEVASVAKGEDRIAPAEADEAPAQDPLAVAPRKVRTMIVKPDGSLVPAEEPAAAAPAEPSVEDIASAQVEEPEQITTGATQPIAVEPEAETVAAAPAPAPGGWAVQIASQPNEDGANKSLKSMSQKYSDVIGDRGLHIVKAEVPKKGTYWRVRVAAASRDDAVSVCSNIKSAGGSCFVTR